MNARQKGQGDAAVQAILSPGNGLATEYCLPDRALIEQRAYEIWIRHGRPDGTAFHDWLAAEAELRSPRRPQ